MRSVRRASCTTYGLLNIRPPDAVHHNSSVSPLVKHIRSARPDVRGEPPSLASLLACMWPPGRNAQEFATERQWFACSFAGESYAMHCTVAPSAELYNYN
ncbi:hypothetical protein PYCCODRAFT_809269 [Trametes coccinea BRFM310]|uniref:Uncharacterized protein n=1 Tax=Trametes coccinea (strain BRFM310) TaxID=1353009 RepID=A0A1Y2IEM7_TRAC3|nr:hypothetical protein PYCCODRAFT_809269 [Trametes coccinea BRFM310]